MPDLFESFREGKKGGVGAIVLKKMKDMSRAWIVIVWERAWVV